MMGVSLDIGFLNISLWDVLDVTIVAYLLYQLYKLLRGSIAFNIFIGLLSLYVIWFVVNQLNMELLSSILDQFAKVGIIVLIIIFQPEVRRFLLLLGNSTLKRHSSFLNKVLDRGNMSASKEDRAHCQTAIAKALLRMSRRREGALIVFTRGVNLEGIVSGGVVMDAKISQGLIESVFNKDSPLHDGAMLIEHQQILKASVILPVSEKTSLPKSVGLRHRAAVGVTEKANVVAFIVSEETGGISYAYEGVLERKLSEERLHSLLKTYL